MKKTKKQSWAQERNFSKMRVAGMIATMKNLQALGSITFTEKAWLHEASFALNHIIRSWEFSEKASKSLYKEMNGGT